MMMDQTAEIRKLGLRMYSTKMKNTASMMRRMMMQRKAMRRRRMAVESTNGLHERMIAGSQVR